MSFDVDKALVQSYHSNIQIKFQQRVSRLRPYCRNETQHAEFDFYDRIGPTDAVEVTSRHGDTPLIGTPHDRRRVALRDFDWADLIDNKDKLRMLADPTSPYVTNAVSAMGRKMDDVIIAAATAIAYTGKTGATQITYPTSTNDVAVNYVESGTATNSNLTIGKLRRVRTLFGLAEADEIDENDAPRLVAAVSPLQLQALLRTTEVTSADYNTVKALVNGAVDTFMGFKFVRTNRITYTSTNIRRTLFWERDGMLLASAQEVMTDIGPRRDKRNSVQVYVCGSFGSARMWEEKVYGVLCDETV